MSEFDRPRKSMWGFKTSPNSEVKVLERWLGLSFKETPPKVDLTQRNLLVYFMRDRKAGWAYMRERKGMASENTAGFYSEDYRTIFLTTGLPRQATWRISIHENLHAYVDQTNSEFYKVNGLDNAESIEKREVYRAFNEGIAYWGTYECELSAGMPEAFHLARHNSPPIADLAQKIVEDVAIDYAYSRLITNSGNNLSLRLDEYTAFNLFSLGVEQERKQAEGESLSLSETRGIISDSQMYILGAYLGYFFVNETMVGLRQEGKSKAEALNLLINNPPDTLAKLHNSYPYISNLLSTPRVSG